jgi:hypothetical protein
VESGGDNLAATFSPELSDLTIYVIDVAGGEKIPRKGGPGITRSDLLIINKTDLAPHVGADLDVMARDARQQRGSRPFIFTNLRSGEGVTQVIDFIREQGLLGQTPHQEHVKKSPPHWRSASPLPLLSPTPARASTRTVSCPASASAHRPRSLAGDAGGGAWSVRQQGARWLPLAFVGMLLVGVATGAAGWWCRAGNRHRADGGVDGRAACRRRTSAGCAGCAMVGVFALLHGNAHGHELPQGSAIGLLLPARCWCMAGVCWAASARRWPSSSGAASPPPA